MVKILNTSSNNNLFFNSEQYNDCSSFLMKADDPPLEELDPAILSCGLPAIVLSDMHQQQQHPAMVSLRAPKIRYTPGQLQAMRKSALCFRRPVVADDPRIGQFAIWKSANQLKRGGRGPYTARAAEQKNGAGDDMNDEKPQEKSLSGIGHQKFPYGRENGFVGPRFRRNYDFNNRNHHVIVKNYRGGGGGFGDDHHHYRLQDTVIEEEPEWMAAGPTSRLDTIELRGFDEDVSPNASLEKTSDGGGIGHQKTGKHISFYDELHHYEHIVSGAKQRDRNTSSGDVESVATSNGSSPPPARSTPTKSVTDSNNNLEGDEKQKLSQQHPNGVNVNNFEEFMKFDSILGSDSSASNISAQSGSRFSKWFRRGTNGYNQSTGANFRQAFLSNNDAFGNNRFSQHQNQQRHFGPQSAAYANRGFHPSESFDQQQGHFGDESNTAFKRLVDMVAHNRISNNLMAQQQYLMQLLNKNQQSEILRRMLMKNAVENVVADANQQQQQQPHSTNNQPRIPTQQELQFHTQSIMQNALLRKKLQDQRKMLYEQATEPANPAVQQFVQSVCPNIQRSLSVLSQTAGANQFATSSSGNSMFPGGSTAAELSNSLQQMLLSQPQQQQGQRHATAGSGRRFGKNSVSWNLN